MLHEDLKVTWGSFSQAWRWWPHPSPEMVGRLDVVDSVSASSLGGKLGYKIAGENRALTPVMAGDGGVVRVVTLVKASLV
jgi:hypothetical protein